MPADGVGEGLEQARRAADPVGEGRSVEIDPLTLEDLALAIERQVISVLRHQHMGQQAWTGSTTLDRARWQRRLDDPLAAGAGHPRTHEAVHNEAAGHIVELFGDVVAETA